MNDTSRNRSLAGLPALALVSAVLLIVSCSSHDTVPEEPHDTADPHQTASSQQPEPGDEAWIDEYDRQIALLAAGQHADATPADVAGAGAQAQADATTSADPLASTPLVTHETAPIQSAPVGLSSQDLASIVAASRERAQLVDDRVAALVAQYVDLGLAALETGDTSAAHEAFGHARELDPGDPGVRDLYYRTGELLGDRASTLGAIAQSAQELERVRRDQARALIGWEVQQGRDDMAADDPAAALRHFENALTQLEFNPEIADGSLRADDLQAHVNSALAALDSDESDRQNRLLSDAMDRQRELEQAEATRQQRRIETLLQAANDSFLREDFADAEDALDTVLRLDPHNEEATALLDVANKARHGQSARDNRERYAWEWRRTFDDLENDATPQVDMIGFPEAKDWASKNERGAKSFASAVEAASAANSAVTARLEDVRIPTSYVDVPLEEIVDNLGQVTGVNFLFSQDAQDELFNLDTLTLQNHAEQPVGRILKILLEDLIDPPMAYTVRDGVCWIIMGDEARSDYVLEFYDIRDLTFTPTDYASEDFNLLPSGTDRDSFVGGVEDDEPLPFINEDRIFELIQENLSPDSWTDDPERTIQLMQGTLVVNQTPFVHSQIRQLLSDLRNNTNTMIHIETRFLEVEDSFLEDVGVDLRGLNTQILEDFGTSGVGFGTPLAPSGIGTNNEAGFFFDDVNGDVKGRIENLFDTMLGDESTLVASGGLSLQALFLKDADINAVLRAVTKFETSNVVNAPSLTLRSGQRGTVEVLTHRTYVRDFEPEIAQGAVIAQPELDNVKEGIVLDVRAVASGDNRFVTLELRPTLAQLIPGANGDPLPEQTVSVAGGNASDVTIQLPQLRIQRLRTTATLPDGATLLLGGLKKSIEEDFKSGVPFLSDIPLLGFFFGRKGEYTSRTKVIILVKATILKPEEYEPRLGF